MSSASPPGSPVEPSASSAGPERLFAWLRGLGLRRDTSDRWVAGVCSGVAAQLGVDPLVVRAGTLVLLLFGGLAIPLYALAWAFLPATDGQIRAEEALRGDTASIALLVVVALLVVGEVTDRSTPWLLVPVGISVWILVHRRRAGCSSSPAAAPRADEQAGVGPVPSPPGDPGPSAATAPAGGQGEGLATPHGMGPGRTWAPSSPPPAPPTPWLPPRRRRPGVGVLGALVVLGAAVLAYWVTAASGATARPAALGLVCAAGTLGLSLLVLGLLGRRAPGLAVLGIAAASAAAIATAVPASLSWSAVRAAGVGETTWRAPADGSATVLRWGAGEATMDLGAFPAPAPGGAPVSASVSLGRLVVLVPPGRSVEIDATVGAGEITRHTGSIEGVPTFHRNGAELRERVLVGSGTPDTRVSADVGIGSVTVVTP